MQHKFRWWLLIHDYCMCGSKGIHETKHIKLNDSHIHMEYGFTFAYNHIDISHTCTVTQLKKKLCIIWIHVYELSQARLGQTRLQSYWMYIMKFYKMFSSSPAFVLVPAEPIWLLPHMQTF